MLHGLRVPIEDFQPQEKFPRQIAMNKEQIKFC